MSTPVNKYYLRSSGEEPADATVTADPPTEEPVLEEELPEEVQINLIENQPEEEVETFYTMSSHISLPPFHGNPGEKAEEWLTWFTSYAAIHNFNEEKVKISLPFFLQSHARAWYDHLPVATKNDYTLLTDGLKERFNGADDVMSDIDMLTLTQKHEESVAEYLTRILKGTNGKGYPQQLLTSMALNGLKDNLKVIVMPQNPNNLEQLRKAATIAEKTVKVTSKDVSVADITKQVIEAMATINMAKTDASSSQPYHRQGQNQMDQHGGYYQQPPVDQFNDYYHQSPIHHPQRPQPHQYSKEPMRQYPRHQPRPVDRRDHNNRPCGRCGGECTSFAICKARGLICPRCKKMNHFAEFCQTDLNQRHQRR